MFSYLIFILIFLFSVFISSVSQILLKKSANKKYGSFLKEYLNLPVILAYSLFLISAMITIFAYKKIPLSFGVILESMGYIFVAILSFIFLNEKFNKKQFLGLTLIVIGVLIFNF